MLETITVPADRVRVLTQDVRERLENETGVSVRMEDNTATLEGEGLELLSAKNFVRAVGRGFSPERAWRLLGEDQLLEVMEVGHLSEAQQRNVRARVIGRGGRMRERIEEATGAAVSVRGKTIAFMGTWAEVHRARKAVEMIIKGSEMSTVSRWLQRGK